jgi:hypothetical protein
MGGLNGKDGKYVRGEVRGLAAPAPFVFLVSESLKPVSLVLCVQRKLGLVGLHYTYCRTCLHLNSKEVLYLPFRSVSWLL